MPWGEDTSGVEADTTVVGAVAEVIATPAFGFDREELLLPAQR